MKTPKEKLLDRLTSIRMHLLDAGYDTNCYICKELFDMVNYINSNYLIVDKKLLKKYVMDNVVLKTNHKSFQDGLCLKNTDAEQYTFEFKYQAYFNMNLIDMDLLPKSYINETVALTVMDDLENLETKLKVEGVLKQ